MKYKSFVDLYGDVARHVNKIPDSVDLIIGIPRSGLLAGNLIALSRNLPLIDIESFIDNRKPDDMLQGVTNSRLQYPREARHALIVDDTVLSGKSLDNTKAMIKEAMIDQNISYCAIYVAPHNIGKVDFYFEKLSAPRAFEWNIMHNNKLETFCVEIDDVLCKKYPQPENLSRKEYSDYLTNASPLIIPSYTIGHLVTGRPKIYRKETEYWLKKHKIRYGKLHMLDSPDTNPAPQVQAAFKGNLYRDCRNSLLFIDGGKKQSKILADISGKPVLCFTDQKLYTAELSVAKFRYTMKHYKRWAIKEVKRIGYNMFKQLQSGPSDVEKT